MKKLQLCRFAAQPQNKSGQIIICPLLSGAQNRTRTCTIAKPLAPETSASTNSATWAISYFVSYSSECAAKVIVFSIYQNYFFVFIPILKSRAIIIPYTLITYINATTAASLIRNSRCFYINGIC